MAGPSKFGPPGGPLSGGMEAQQDYANQAHKANQAKRDAIHEAAKQLAPKEGPKPDQKDRDPGR